jgi:hypothetical protein
MVGRESRRRALRGACIALGLGALACQEPRSIDGSGNNLQATEMGATATTLARMLESDYADGVDGMAGPTRPGARAVSNGVSAQGGSIPEPHGASGFVWQWGQFLDHDISLTPLADPPEPYDIPVPAGDPDFDPFFSGTQVIAFDRSLYHPGTGVGSEHPREQMNMITAWIDASNVYGSDSARAQALRRLDGTGRLDTSAGELLPFNVSGLPNAGGPGQDLFLAGDVRANEQVALSAMHTLFVREHNRLAGGLRRQFRDWTGDRIYEAARALVGAEMQAITYEEFLPALLGPHALAPYDGYDPGVDASIANLFSVACYRFGHSMLSSRLLRLDSRNREIAEGHLALREAFFAPWRITEEGGIAPLLRGLAAQPAERIDPYVVDDVRSFLFGTPGAGGLDLAALNIQRGRDHGLPSYVDARATLGLSVPDGFADVSSDSGIRARLEASYGTVEAVDVWVGGLAEDSLPGAMLGELLHTVLTVQFESLRDGDRYFYATWFGPQLRRWIGGVRLSDVIRRNTRIRREIPDDVFHVRPHP